MSQSPFALPPAYENVEKDDSLLPEVFKPTSSPNIMEGALVPTASSATRRYESRWCSQLVPLEIGSGPLHGRGDQQSLPRPWMSYTDPEGQTYFNRRTPFRVVTMTYLCRPSLLEKVSFWTKRIEDLASQQNLSLSGNQHIELFVWVDESSPDCHYYFVDFEKHTEFWLETLNTEILELPYVVSYTHLESELHGQFWSHVEQYPMHFGGLSQKDVDELISIFSHGLIDQMTSELSTFFFDKSTCEAFLRQLKIARENSTDGYQTCVVARLWNLIWDQRVSTHYGEENPRLSRDQRIITEAPRRRWTSRIASVLSFGGSDYYHDRLDDIYCDELVSVYHWRPFMNECLEEWKKTSFLALGTLVLQQLATSVAQPVVFHRGLAYGSMGALSVSLTAALYLGHSNRSMGRATATRAFDHLSAIKSFTSLSTLYALPMAGYYWGLLLMVASLVAGFAGLTGMIVGAGLGLALLSIGYVFRRGEEWRLWRKREYAERGGDVAIV